MTNSTLEPMVDPIPIPNLPEINPFTGEELHLCVDADCPSCGWAERWFAVQRGVFGCPKCSYESTERDA